MRFIYVVIDIRDDEICWSGTKKDCKWWLSMTDPDNKPYYKIIKMEEMTKREKIFYIISVISFILTLVGGFIIASGYKYIGLIISIPSAIIFSIFLSMLMEEKGL